MNEREAYSNKTCAAKSSSERLGATLLFAHLRMALYSRVGYNCYALLQLHMPLQVILPVYAIFLIIFIFQP